MDVKGAKALSERLAEAARNVDPPPEKRWTQETPTEDQRSPTLGRLPELTREVPAPRRRRHRHGSRALAPDWVLDQPARRAARLAVGRCGRRKTRSSHPAHLLSFAAPSTMPSSRDAEAWIAHWPTLEGPLL